MLLDIAKELEEDIIKIIREKCNSIFEDSTEEINKRNKAGGLLIQITTLEKERREYIKWVKDDSFELTNNSEPIPRMDFEHLKKRMAKFGLDLEK